MENNILEVSLIVDKGLQRFYRLNKKLTKFPNKNFDYSKELEYQLGRVKPEFKHFIEVLKDGTDVICISDAHTHIERLAFPGIEFELDGKPDYGRFSLQCDGAHTFMIHGGNSDAVYSDEVYLRRIASANGLTLKMT